MNLFKVRSVKALILWFTRAIQLLHLSNDSVTKDGESDDQPPPKGAVSAKLTEPLTRLIRPLQRFLPQMDNLQGELEHDSDQLEELVLTRSTLIKERNLAYKDLETAARHAALNILNHQIREGTVKGELHVESLRERPEGNLLAWVPYTKRVLRVHDLLLTMGYGENLTPNREQLTQLMDGALAADTEANAAGTAVLEARAKLRETQGKGQELVSQIAAFLRYYYGHQSKETLRQIMRLIGYTFKNGSAPPETNDPETENGDNGTIPFPAGDGENTEA